MTAFRAWWSRLWAPREDPVARVCRMLDAAKSRQLAMMAWKDPDFGEVMTSFYAAPAQAQTLDDIKQPTAEEMLLHRVREMAPGFQGAPLPKPSRSPPGLRPDSAGMDV